MPCWLLIIQPSTKCFEVDTIEEKIFCQVFIPELSDRELYDTHIVAHIFFSFTLYLSVCKLPLFAKPFEVKESEFILDKTEERGKEFEAM